LGIVGDFLILAAALAFRWNYSIRRWHALPVLAYALYTARFGPLVKIPFAVQGSGWVLGGVVVVLAGLTFWPWRGEAPSPAGRRFLAVSIALWGLHRMAMAYVPPSNDLVFVTVNVTFVLIYYLVVFAIVIVVLDRARSEAATLKEFNERLIDGLGEGLQLVDDTFAVRHANRWLDVERPVAAGRRCYERLTADGRQCPPCPIPKLA